MMGASDLQDTWPWLTPDELESRIVNEIQNGRMVHMNEEEKVRFDAGDWRRVSTWGECEVCSIANCLHPTFVEIGWLHKLCNGTMGKT